MTLILLVLKWVLLVAVFIVAVQIAIPLLWAVLLAAFAMVATLTVGVGCASLMVIGFAVDGVRWLFKKGAK